MKTLISQNPDFDVKENEADMGIIESILWKNFMCHSVLEFRFNLNVNYVIGRDDNFTVKALMEKHRL